MGRKKTYTLSGFIVISLGIMVAMYPVVNYYTSNYAHDSHAVLKPGNNFVYAGIIPYQKMLIMYNITYIGNGKFNVSFDTYNITQKTSQCTTFPASQSLGL